MNNYGIKYTMRGYFLNIILFSCTVVTTLIAGAVQTGVNPMDSVSNLLRGAPFAFTIIAILLSHEMGHFIVSHRNGVDATLPYFIPAPTLMGTFGAIIRMRSPVWHKKALLDIGAAGPLAGIAVTIPAVIYGLSLSEVKAVETAANGIRLGDSLLLTFLTQLVFGTIPVGQEVFLHPVAFAGWIGLLVTSMNLLPIGQLDGGHIAYALFGRYQEAVSRIVLIGLFTAGIMWWKGWLFWAALSVIFGMRHPPPVYPMIPLGQGRRLVGILCLVVFVLTFVPVPISTP